LIFELAALSRGEGTFQKAVRKKEKKVRRKKKRRNEKRGNIIRWSGKRSTLFAEKYL